MNDPATAARNTLTWKSITVLPPLIVVSAVTVVLVAFRQGLSLRMGLSLFVGVLAIVEIGYLLVLIAVNRRGGSLHPSPER